MLRRQHHALLNGLNPERGVEYAYELVRRNFDDHIARGTYIANLGLGEDEYRFPNHPVVVPGSAIRYKLDDTGEEKWLIVEDAPDPKHEREEYPPSHVWSQDLMGKSVEGKFTYRRDNIQPRTATILAIISKFLYRKIEIINGWEERFPGEDKYFVRKYTIPKNPDGSPDISFILQTLDEREKQKEEMHAFYRANPISAATFAMVANTGLLESLSHIAGEGTLPIRCCLGNELEFLRGVSSLATAEHFILDPSALATLYFSNQYEQLQLLSGKVSLCESSLIEYGELREKFSTPSHGFMGKFKGKYLFQKNDSNEYQRQLDRLDKFLSRIRSLVSLRTGEKLAHLQAEKREEIIGLFGQPTAETMADAAATGAVLWSDDLAVAEVGRERFGISKRVWSQLVFREHAPLEVMTEFTLFLIQWRYFFTRIEPDIVLAACRDGSWNLEAPVLKSIAEWLGQPELIHEGAIRMCIQSLPLVWKHGPDQQQKQGVAKLLLQAVRLRKDGRRAISIIQRNLESAFSGDNTAWLECDAVINDMIEAERTPEELAASKAAWFRELRKFKKRMSNSTMTGNDQKMPKQLSHNRKDGRKRKKR